MTNEYKLLKALLNNTLDNCELTKNVKEVGPTPYEIAEGLYALQSKFGSSTLSYTIDAIEIALHNTLNEMNIHATVYHDGNEDYNKWDVFLGNHFLSFHLESTKKKYILTGVIELDE